MGSSPPRYVFPTTSSYAVTNLTQIFMGKLVWEELDENEVRSKILDGDRPRRPEGEKKRTLTTELWRMFAKCWVKEPGGRISVPGALDVLRYLWVLN